MNGQKISIDDLLKEYANNTTNSKPVSDSRLETEKLLNSADKLSGRKTAEEIIKENDHLRTLRKHSQPAADASLRRPNPANDVKPGEVKQNKVSFVKSGAMNDIRTGPSRNPEPAIPSPQTSADNAPRIRRMSDSTRAKEVESIKKRKKRRKDDNNFTYERETPDGEYMYIPPKVKKKKRSRSVREEFELPENRRLTTDVVPSPAVLEATRPVTPAPRAETTKINLSTSADFDDNSIDVHITQRNDEFEEVNYKKKRTKRMVDFDYYGDVEDVGRDIFDLKNTISVRVQILIAVSVLSVYTIIANSFGLPIVDFLNQSNIFSFLTSNLVMGLIALLSSFTVIVNGWKKLFTFRADNDSMTAVTFTACMLSLIVSFFATDMLKSDIIHIYMPVGILTLLTNSVGKYLIVNRASKNFKYISQDVERYGVTYVQNEERAEMLTRGTLGDFPILASMRKTEFLTDFLRYSYSSDTTDSFCHKASPLCLTASLLISVVITYFRMENFLSIDSLAFGFSILTLLLCASACIALPLVSNIPLGNVANRIYKNHGVMLGYQSVNDFYDTNSILIDAEKLFPYGSVTMGGVKIFSNTKVDDALLQAASLTHHAGSIMQQLFAEVIAERGESGLYYIDNFSYEESMGLCGWINNKRVLFGSREFMISHNIEGIPTKTKEDEYCEEKMEAMYLSVSGNLAAMFIVNIQANREVKNWVNRLDKKKICLIIRSVDPCISLKRLSTLFDVPEAVMRIIPKKLHEEFEAETERTVRLSSSMACSGKFTTLAQLILGTKVVHSATILGLIIQSVSILLGLALCGMLLIAKGFDYNFVSSSSIIIYNLICTAITYIAVSMKRL